MHSLQPSCTGAMARSEGSWTGRYGCFLVVQCCVMLVAVCRPLTVWNVQQCSAIDTRWLTVDIHNHNNANHSRPSAASVGPLLSPQPSVSSFSSHHCCDTPLARSPSTTCCAARHDNTHPIGASPSSSLRRMSSVAHASEAAIDTYTGGQFVPPVEPHRATHDTRGAAAPRQPVLKVCVVVVVVVVNTCGVFIRHGVQCVYCSKASSAICTQMCMYVIVYSCIPTYLVVSPQTSNPTPSTHSA